MLSLNEENIDYFVRVGISISKCKRRKIYVNRDFPHGCGPNAPQIIVSPIDYSSFGHSDLQSIGIDDESSLDIHSVGAHDFIKPKDFEVAKYPNQITADSSPLNSSLSSVFNFPLQQEKLNFDSILVKILDRKYPPRRRISAIRDFPLHCGSDTKHCLLNNLTDENGYECMNLSSLESGQDSKAAGTIRCKPGHLPSCNVGDKVKDDSGSSDVHELHDTTGPFCENTDTTYIETHMKCIHPHKDHTSRVKNSESGNKDVISNVKSGELDVDIGKEVYVHKKENQHSDQILGNGVGVCDAKMLDADNHHSEGSGSKEQHICASDNLANTVIVLALIFGPKWKNFTFHTEDKHMRDKHTYSPLNVDRVIVNALAAGPICNGYGVGVCDTEMFDAGDVHSKGSGSKGKHVYTSSDNSANRVIVLALTAGHNCKEIAVHTEDKHLRREHSHSPLNVLNAAPISKETDHQLEDECLKRKYESKNPRRKVVVHALMAARNCPWRKSKVADLSSHNGIDTSRGLNLESNSSKQKSNKKQIVGERRVLINESKRKRGHGDHMEATPPWSSHPSKNLVEGEVNELYSWEQVEGCDDLYVSRITHDIGLLPVVPSNAKMSKCFNEEALAGKHVDPVSSKMLKDQGKYINTGSQTVGPVPGQPELTGSVIQKSKVRHGHGVCVQDISGGSELIPIRAVNTIDEQKPPSFKYITSMLYPDWCRPLPLRGCNCVGGCSSSANCACAVRNGGEIPFNKYGSIVEVKPLVYECGPSCKCPPSCPNRVSQFGIKFQLEIFKTESRGWGVRSLDYIPSGSFICEYMGELLEDKQAEQRIDSDEYLFDIGSNYGDRHISNQLPNTMPHPQIGPSDVVDDIGFTIDGKRYGNVGRFINHSCSPNLYAQNVLYDHENRRVPHIMLFATDNIPPFQELTYHYNYNIGEVRDANGNVKIKQCFCGSVECTGRLY